jgi:hypothetical protein
MKFGYFLKSIDTHPTGALAHISIQPLSAEMRETGGYITAHIPIGTAHADQSLEAIAATVLQAAQTLLSEQALAAWAATWPQDGFVPATVPPDARELLAEWEPKL